VTTKEVWKLIGTLKDIIRHQTAVIESTQNELQEIKHNQHVLQEQNEKLHEEVSNRQIVAGDYNTTTPR
jgi:cell division protein FtsB